MIQLNRTFKGDRIVAFDPTRTVPALTPAQTERLATFAQRRYNGELFNVGHFATFMDFLIWPYECAVQPWWDRARRNGRYGGTGGHGDRVRQQVSTPNGNKANKYAYLHYEYRVPSTWLCHPWLAYAYLGLAKLSMLNAKLISEARAEPLRKHPDGTSANADYRKIFMNRFTGLVKSGRWTSDIRGLIDVIPKTFDQRAAWFENPGQPIDVDAWRRLL